MLKFNHTEDFKINPIFSFSLVLSRKYMYAHLCLLGQGVGFNFVSADKMINKQDVYRTYRMVWGNFLTKRVVWDFSK